MTLPMPEPERSRVMAVRLGERSFDEVHRRDRRGRGPSGGGARADLPPGGARPRRRRRVPRRRLPPRLGLAVTEGAPRRERAGAPVSTRSASVAQRKSTGLRTRARRFEPSRGLLHADVAKSADAPVSETGGEIHEGSTPSIRISYSARQRRRAPRRPERPLRGNPRGNHDARDRIACAVLRLRRRVRTRTTGEVGARRRSRGPCGSRAGGPASNRTRRP